jgi:hypothetical protein
MCTVIVRYVRILYPYALALKKSIKSLLSQSVLSLSFIDYIMQCWGLGIFIPAPGSWFLSIPVPGSRIQKQQQERRMKINLLSHLFCSHKYHKVINYFIFELMKKKIWANLQRIIELLTQNIGIKLSKYRFGTRDPGSATNLFRISDPDPQSWCNEVSVTRYLMKKILWINCVRISL